MPGKKYDYNALKLEYFKSDIDDFRAFIEQKLGKKALSGSMNAKTKGRAKEKQAYKDKILQRALEANAKKQAEALDIPVDILKKAKKNGIVGLINDLSNKDKKLSVSDRIKAVNAIKTELGEPTTISKNENLNKGVTLNEADFIQD
jgi:hypothetical protein